MFGIAIFLALGSALASGVKYSLRKGTLKSAYNRAESLLNQELQMKENLERSELKNLTDRELIRGEFSGVLAGNISDYQAFIDAQNESLRSAQFERDAWAREKLRVERENALDNLFLESLIGATENLSKTPSNAVNLQNYLDTLNSNNQKKKGLLNQNILPEGGASDPNVQ